MLLLLLTHFAIMKSHASQILILKHTQTRDDVFLRFGCEEKINFMVVTLSVAA